MIRTAEQVNSLFEDVPAGRRRIMNSIRSKDTKPERLVRSMLQAAGYRFRKNFKSLPGRPDVVFTAKKMAVFVHGCFWHAHKGCSNAARPQTRSSYWNAKLDRTINRDREHLAALRKLGWKATVVWECDLKNPNRVRLRLAKFLGPRASQKLRDKNRSKPKNLK
jgi:DNA mismatch endonuclease Vsr